MAGTSPTTRAWLVQIVPDEVQIRCAYQRVGKSIVRFTVQLEIRHLGTWRPVVRYDNAHGFCHRDTVHADGTQDKTTVFVGDVNTTFTHAIEDLRIHWEAHRARFLREAGPS
jgi:hypothetical protein